MRKVTGTFVHPAGVWTVEGVEDTLSGQSWFRIIYGERIKYDRLRDTDAVEFYLGRHDLSLADLEEVIEEQR
jgi:hypothetical protein